MHNNHRFTFDVYISLKKSDWFKLEKCGEIFDADAEWVPVVELQMHVYVKAEVCLYVTTKWLQEMLDEKCRYKSIVHCDIKSLNALIQLNFTWIIFICINKIVEIFPVFTTRSV